MSTKCWGVDKIRPEALALTRHMPIPLSAVQSPLSFLLLFLLLTGVQGFTISGKRSVLLNYRILLPTLPLI